MRIPIGEHLVDCPTCEGRGYLTRDERSEVLAERARLTGVQVAREVCEALRPIRNVPYTVGDQNYLTPEEAVMAVLRAKAGDQ